MTDRKLLGGWPEAAITVAVLLVAYLLLTTGASAQVIEGRPAGCPYRYCGCALSIKIFSKIVPELNLAANWVRKFPRTAPAPGMVAARSGHAMQLESHVSGDIWNVYDPNSGGHRTRLHQRSTRGYAIVNPHG